MNANTPRPKSRRTRLLAVAAGALSVAALLPAGASAAVQSPTDSWLQYQPPGQGVSPFIFGGFSTQKKACEHRTVDVFRSKDQMNWDYVWHSEVVDGPNPGLTVNLQSADRGYYYVLSAERATISKKGKKIVCQPDQSEAVYAS